MANEFSQYFIDLARTRFGDHFVTMAVHCFTHLPHETMKHGPLETFSVFKFENNLKSLKSHMTNNMVNPLATVRGFLTKKSTYVSKASGDTFPAKGSSPKLKKQLSMTDFAVLILPNMYLSADPDTRNPDCYVMANDRIFRIERIYVTAPGEGQENSIQLGCRKQKAVSAYYIDRSGGSRFESSQIGVYRLSKIPCITLQTIRISDIQTKYVVNRLHKGQMVGHPLIDSQ